MPDDPLKHEFGASVIATYKCAMLIIGALDNLQKALPDRTNRIFFIFSHALSSAVSPRPAFPSTSLFISCKVSLAGLVIWAPGLPMAANALFELDRVHTIFKKAAENHRIRMSLVSAGLVSVDADINMNALVAHNHKAQERGTSQLCCI